MYNIGVYHEGARWHKTRCPICFTYNRNDRIYHMPVAEMERIISWIVTSSGRVDLINITGGEPTLHPQLLDLLRACRHPDIGRVTLNSNGIRLAEDFDLCRRLADLDVYVILSLNTFDPQTSRLMHGRDLTVIKQRAIDHLVRAGVRMTLLNVLMRGVNENDLSGLLALMRQHDNILSLTVQTMTYTGQGGACFQRARHLPVDEAARLVCRHSAGALAFDDFCTRPSAHPLCYLVCYLLRSDGRLLPLSRFASRDQVQKLLQDSYLVRPAATWDFFSEAINQLYAQGRTEHLAVLRRLVGQLYPPRQTLDEFSRQRIAESQVRTVYIHAHMDEDTFDCSRAMLCPDLVPAEAGRLIPACTYNLFYRMQDERFYASAGGKEP